MSFFEFPHTRTYDSDLGWLIKKMKEIIEDVAQQNTAIDNKFEEQDGRILAVEQLAEELKTFVNNYFNNLDVQEEINNKIDEMAEDGTLETIISQVLKKQTGSLICSIAYKILILFIILFNFDWHFVFRLVLIN